MSSIKPGRILGGLGLLGIGAFGGWIAWSNLLVDHNMELPLAVNAELNAFTSPTAGELAYYADTSGSGRPVVLLHSINAAATTYEMKPLFEYYAGKRPVYSLDLPGFGFSERSDRVYSPQLYQDAIADFLMEVVGEEADVIALSLTSEFTAAVALNHPETINRLVLISPTGFGQLNVPESESSLYDVFAFPLWDRAFFDLLTVKPSINLFLGATFSNGVPEDFGNYAYLSAHQPGAQHAPLYFVSGRLFRQDIYDEVYVNLDQPTLALYGRDPDVTFERLPELAENNDNWTARDAQYRLPHWDGTAMTIEMIESFFNE